MKTLFCLGRNGVQLLVVKRGKRYRERQVQFTYLNTALSWCRTRGVSFIWTPTGAAVSSRK